MQESGQRGRKNYVLKYLVYVDITNQRIQAERLWINYLEALLWYNIIKEGNNNGKVDPYDTT